MDLSAFFDRMWRHGDGQPEVSPGERAVRAYRRSLRPMEGAKGVRSWGEPERNASDARRVEDPRVENRDWRVLPVGPAFNGEPKEEERVARMIS
mmetsp:Transcript_35215/g.85755  ORF Transcript_35215/g.85755 Transcript_35215/m.85755 type:complete len:94 (+) Transcript_35215:168-449(+)